MKRMTGWIFTIGGGITAALGAVTVLTGTSQSTVVSVSGTSLNGMTTGLIGLAVLTVGLIWVRD